MPNSAQGSLVGVQGTICGTMAGFMQVVTLKHVLSVWLLLAFLACSMFTSKS